METRHIIQKGGQGSDRLPGKEAAFTHAHAGFAPMDVVPCGNNGYPNRCNRFVGVSGNRVYPGRDGMRDWPWENLYMLQM